MIPGNQVPEVGGPDAHLIAPAGYALQRALVHQIADTLGNVLFVTLEAPGQRMNIGQRLAGLELPV